MILQDDISNSDAHIIVSSDDNHLTAEGGVAKAIIKRAGNEQIRRELRHYLADRTQKNLGLMSQGEMAITSGGKLNAAAIFHPAVIHFEEDLYPTPAIIRRIVWRSLVCAEALGMERIAFPVLGGGTASRNLSPWDSIKAILTETVEFLNRPQTNPPHKLKHVALYIFDPKDIEGDFAHEITEILAPPS